MQTNQSQTPMTEREQAIMEIDMINKANRAGLQKRLLKMVYLDIEPEEPEIKWLGTRKVKITKPEAEINWIGVRRVKLHRELTPIEKLFEKLRAIEEEDEEEQYSGKRLGRLKMRVEPELIWAEDTIQDMERHLYIIGNDTDGWEIM